MPEGEAGSGLRGDVAAALEGFLTAEQLRLLLDEILQVKKGARGWCPSCKRQVQVEISDARAVTSAITDLATQAFGRPQVQEQDGERIVFERVVYMGGDAA